MTEPTAPSAEPATAAPEPPPAPVDKQARRWSEPEVLGGRALIGIAMLGAIGLVSWQWLNGVIDRSLHDPKRPKPTADWAVGSEADIELTLITADAKRLSCAHDQLVDSTHCGFTANKARWRRVANAPLDDNDEQVIQPYRTADTNALVLVSGLWAQPELALRLHREPPALDDVDKHLRFVAYCHVRFIGELEGVATRWDTKNKWIDESKALVAKPVHCTLQPPNG
jgi:hypothetical protein